MRKWERRPINQRTLGDPAHPQSAGFVHGPNVTHPLIERLQRLCHPWQDTQDDRVLKHVRPCFVRPVN
jgi:hypothetical protein